MHCIWRHPGAGRDPVAGAFDFRRGLQKQKPAGPHIDARGRYWIPACAGMTLMEWRGEIERKSLRKS